MEISNGYCPDCYYRRPLGSMSVGRRPYRYQETIRKQVDMVLNEQGYYECPSCHLQTVWVDKDYPFLWILKSRGEGKFRDMTHPALYSDVGGQNKRYLGGFEYFIKVFALQRWKKDSGEKIDGGSWWENYIEFLISGWAKNYNKSLTYSEIMKEIACKFGEPPFESLEKGMLPFAIELRTSTQIQIYIESEVEMMTETQELEGGVESQ